MRIELEQATCEGTGFCAQVAPEHFDLDGGKARLVAEDVTPDTEGRAEEAETLCPTQSIRLRLEPEA